MHSLLNSCGVVMTLRMAIFCQLGLCVAFLTLIAVDAQSPLTNAACQTMAMQYPDKLYWPGSPQYSNETQGKLGHAVACSSYVPECLLI